MFCRQRPARLEIIAGGQEHSVGKKTEQRKDNRAEEGKQSRGRKTEQKLTGMGHVCRTAPQLPSTQCSHQTIVEPRMLTGVKQGQREVAPVCYNPRVTRDWNETGARLTFEPCCRSRVL